ncbi:MAG: EAL domain-containing protein [Pigmentiphaga sp.]|nr:EAL domain-containing protein [Pigmentiphaga sp.]
MKTHCLIVRLGGLQALRDSMGRTVTTAVLTYLDKALPPAVSTVLDHPRITVLLGTSPEPGLWRWTFTCRAGQGPLHDLELASTIQESLDGALAEIAHEVFGFASASMAKLEAALLPADATCSVADAFAARVQVCPRVSADDAQALRSLLGGTGLRVFLQPLLRLSDGALIGFEALARGPAGSTLETADRLFGIARRCGLEPALELACINAALAWRDRLPAELLLSINVSARTLALPTVVERLARPGILVELTERLPLNRVGELAPLLARLRQAGARLARLRQAGARLALDDAGCGFADLQAAQAMRPDVVKLCITIVNALGRQPALLEELRTTVAMLHGLGCEVLAEGIETREMAEILDELGIDYGQGWFYGRPALASLMLASYQSA